MKKIIILFALLILLPVVMASYDSSDNWEYYISQYDTANRGYVPGSQVGQIDDVDDGGLLCNLDFDLEYQPKIFSYDSHTYVLLQSSSNIRIYDSSCQVISELEGVITEDIIAESLLLKDTAYSGDNTLILVPLADATIEQFIFNGSLISNKTYTGVANITGSGGSCQQMLNSSYTAICYWQTIYNNLTEIKPVEETYREISVIDGDYVDTVYRKPAISAPVLNDKIMVLGMNTEGGTDELYACEYDYSLDALSTTWGGTGCILIENDVKQDAVNGDRYVPPYAGDLDGGNNDYVFAWIDGGLTPHIALYSASGTEKKKIGTGLSATISMIFEQFNTSSGSSAPGACIFSGSGQYCVGIGLNGVIKDTGYYITDTDMTKTQVITADIDADTAGKEIISTNDNEYNIFHTEEGLVTEDVGINFSFNGYFAVGDIDDNNYLDLVYESDSRTYFRTVSDLNDPPAWTQSTDLFTLGADSLQVCNGTTYTVTSSLHYSDDNSDQVRMVVDCVNDGNVVYSDYASATSGGDSSDYLTADCTFNSTGTKTMKVWLEDDKGLTSTNASLIFSVSNDIVCSLPGTGTVAQGESITPDQDEQFDDTLDPIFGASSKMKLLAGMGIVIGVAMAGATYAGIVGFVGGALLSLILVTFLDLTPVWISILVLVSMLLLLLLSRVILGAGGSNG